MSTGKKKERKEERKEGKGGGREGTYQRSSGWMEAYTLKFRLNGSLAVGLEGLGAS